MTGKTSRSVVLMVACVFVALAGTVSAATVTEREATAAASAFIMADPVGSAVLRGRTVSTVYERDGLWIAALSPSGHVILSGSDLGIRFDVHRRNQEYADSRRTDVQFGHSFFLGFRYKRDMVVSGNSR